jgi:hypothetical protein
MMAQVVPIANEEPEYYTAEELARRWKVSSTTIRRWFRKEPGVMKWGRTQSKPGKKRAYLSLRIPREVVERVRRRLSLD